MFTELRPPTARQSLLPGQNLVRGKSHLTAQGMVRVPLPLLPPGNGIPEGQCPCRLFPFGSLLVG
jgi:hypothetical protein